jgi:hypothetical protein
MPASPATGVKPLPAPASQIDREAAAAGALDPDEAAVAAKPDGLSAPTGPVWAKVTLPLYSLFSPSALSIAIAPPASSNRHWA